MNTTLKHIRTLYILVGLLAIVALILLFAGCSTNTTVASDPKASSAAEPPAQTPPPVNNFLKQFGDTITWEDGTSISISTPAPYVPTEYAAGVVDGASHVSFEIVLTNGTDEPLNPSTVWATASSGGQEASSIIDTSSELGQIGLSPMTTLLPGQTVKWIAAYSVADPASINVEIHPSYVYEAGIFTNVPF